MSKEKDYIEQMHEELELLGHRIEKLKAFYDARYIRNLDNFTRYLLKKQLKQMKAYKHTLKIRILFEESKAKENQHEQTHHG